MHSRATAAINEPSHASASMDKEKQPTNSTVHFPNERMPGSKNSNKLPTTTNAYFTFVLEYKVMSVIVAFSV